MSFINQRGYTCIKWKKESKKTKDFIIFTDNIEKDKIIMSSIIHIDEIQPGMVLGAPILNRYGQTLLAAGVVVDDKHLQMFKTWGVKHITIENENTQTSEPRIVSEELMNLAKMHIKKRMLWETSTPLEEDLFNAALDRVIDTYSSGELESNND